MPITVPGEYTGPMVRTGWLQFPAVPTFTTMRLRCLQLKTPPTMDVNDRYVRCALLSLSSIPVTLTVSQALSDQWASSGVTLTGSTTTGIKTDQTAMVVNAYAGSTAWVGQTKVTVSSNTATDLTVTPALTTAPLDGVPFIVYYPRTAVVTTPATITVQPRGFINFSFSPSMPIVEFYTAAGPANEESVRIQLESIMRFEILPFAKSDPFYPQQIVAADIPPWSALM